MIGEIGKQNLLFFWISNVYIFWKNIPLFSKNHW